MPLFDPSTINVNKTLEEALGKGAESARTNIKDQYSRLRKRLVSGQAASGRLTSGVADYPLTELDTSEGRAIGDVESRLAESLGGYGAKEYFDDKDFTQNKELAALIGKLSKRTELEQVLGGLGGLGQLAGGIAGFF